MKKEVIQSTINWTKMQNRGIKTVGESKFTGVVH